MNRILYTISDIDPIELNYLTLMTEKMDEEIFNRFISIFIARRKNPTHVLVLCLIGLFGFGGIHRFYLSQIGMGLLYFFTLGLCYIGTIVDCINHKKLTTEANIRIANEVMLMIEQPFYDQNQF
ncbi:MAG: hypothetical protein B7C24_15500 [Bacteroidetes bacterium 4572_77]|nr:MAG: hypothetical protein B7C24_15500 [Bacteroidetes bacterium 4572_77]